MHTIFLSSVAMTVSSEQTTQDNLRDTISRLLDYSKHITYTEFVLEMVLSQP